MKILKLLFVGMLLVLAACGPAEVEQGANEAASAVSSASIPPGAEQTAAAALNDPTAQALLEQAGAELEGLVPSDLRLQRDQPLVLDTTREVAGVTNYKWTVSQAPAGAESAKGQVIRENSNGKLTLEPADYEKYFPVAGDYTIDLELTFTDGTKQTVPLEVTAP
ncbi:MAG TPA: hypothetical protein VFZ66_11490 [Herpetosiphonaceae bacterium]